MSAALILPAAPADVAWLGWRIPAAEIRGVADAASAVTELGRLRAQLQAQAEAAFEQARQEGLAAGLAEAAAAAAREKAEAVAAFQGRLDRLELDMTRRLSALSLAIVRRLAGGVACESLVAAAAGEAARRLVRENPLRVRTHPASCEQVAARLGDLMPGVAVEPDNQAPIGGCVFEMAGGEVDVGIELQLAALEAAFRPLVEGGAA